MGFVGAEGLQAALFMWQGPSLQQPLQAGAHWSGRQLHANTCVYRPARSERDGRAAAEPDGAAAAAGQRGAAGRRGRRAQQGDIAPAGERGGDLDTADQAGVSGKERGACACLQGSRMTSLVAFRLHAHSACCTLRRLMLPAPHAPLHCRC